MSIETKNNIETPENLNKELFDKSFEEELTNGEIVDHKGFSDLINGMKYNENLSGQENLQNGYIEKISNNIDSLKNIDTEEKNQLLQNQLEWVKGKSANEILNAFKDIKNVDLNGEGELAKNQKDLSGGDKKVENNDKSAIDKLKDAISKNNDAEAEKKEELKKEQEKRDNNVIKEQNEAETMIAGFPDSIKEGKA
ncbi:MAG: hypothetical protein NWP80_00935 [Candidatus Gracilibacteria bacterium]|nr:hypothetical protein [Candidatus Gracilibacteria bacterium]